jgi:hypothetical protein
MECFILVFVTGFTHRDGKIAFFIAGDDAFATTDAFVGVDEEVGGSVGKHLIDGVEATGGNALEALGAFGLVDGIKIGRAFAGIDQDCSEQGQQK